MAIWIRIIIPIATSESRALAHVLAVGWWPAFISLTGRGLTTHVGWQRLSAAGQAMATFYYSPLELRH